MLRMFVLVSVSALTACWATAQEYDFFAMEDGNPNAVIGWDMFTGFYAQPHGNSIGDSLGVITASPTGGLVSSTMNLYGFMTVPTFQFELSNLESSEPFTSIVIQIATTELIDEMRFDTLPDEFIELGALSTLGFDGDELDVNYYWAEWQGMAATESFVCELQSMQMHVSFCGARVAYFNTAEPLDVAMKGDFLLGDMNCDGVVNLLDVMPFVDMIANNGYSEKADMNQDGSVNLLDVEPFVALLAG